MYAYKLAGCSLALILPLALAGCDSSDKKIPVGNNVPASGAASVAASSTLDPKQQLTASTVELAKGNYAFTGQECSMGTSGELDKASQTASLLVKWDSGGSGNYSFEYRVFPDGAVFKAQTSDKQLTDEMKITLGQWYSLDKATATKALEDVELGVGTIGQADPGGSMAAVKSAVTVKRESGGSFSGTTNLADNKALRWANDAQVSELGDQAKQLPFTAKLDSAGRLASFSVRVPAAIENPVCEYQATYSNFGQAKKQERPEGAIPAPKSLIDFLASE